MGKHSAIEWTDDTWNPWYGCLKVSQGCKQCYMYRDMKRYGGEPDVVKKASRKTFYAPLKFESGHKVFTCSWSDFFIEHADEWRDEAWQIIKQTPSLTYQILTKRPENILSRLPKDWGEGYENVWLGVSVEDQEHIWRLYLLLHLPAHVHWLSYEPALDSIYLNEAISGFKHKLDWLVSGGESGSKPRKAEMEWFKSIRDQCRTFGIKYFHKQNGGNRKINGAWGGREIDGETYDEMPV